MCLAETYIRAGTALRCRGSLFRRLTERAPVACLKQIIYHPRHSVQPHPPGPAIENVDLDQRITWTPCALYFAHKFHLDFTVTWTLLYQEHHQLWQAQSSSRSHARQTKRASLEAQPTRRSFERQKSHEQAQNREPGCSRRREADESVDYGIRRTGET